MRTRKLKVRHEPTVLSARGGAWVVCSCGHKTATYESAKVASFWWAEHVRIQGKG